MRLQHMPIKIAIVYYSGQGHTQKVAEYVQRGVEQIQGCQATLICVNQLEDVTVLNPYHMIVMGAPVYMGSVPYQFKAFMDRCSNVWFQQQWKGKLAAGFANSFGLAGDKFNVLMQMVTFAAQQGMLWVPLGIGTATSSEDEMGNPVILNRLGGSLGLITQSDNQDPTTTPGISDCQTAQLFGQRISQVAQQYWQKN